MSQPKDPQNSLQHELSWSELLAGYVLGDLTPEETAQVKEHLSAHPELGAEVRALQATLSLLPLSLPETELPDVGLQQSVSAARQSQQLKLLGLTPDQRWRRIVAGVGIGLGLLALGLGFESYRLRQELAAARTDLAQSQSLAASRANNHLFFLKATDAMYSASGSLVVIPDDQQVLLNIQNLRSLPSGQTYRLWTVVQGKHVKCADFNTSPQGHIFVVMPLDHRLLHSPSVLITVESTQPNVQQRGSAVMVGRQVI